MLIENHFEESKWWYSVYIDEAIMKMEANKAGANPRIRLKSLLNNVANDARHIGACISIKSCT